jgi:acyl dehydratase
MRHIAWQTIGEQQRNGLLAMANAETVPPAERYFEDYHVGMVDEFGEVVVSADEIMAFARRYDPQAMHVDPASAAHGAFGGLIDSGWDTTGPQPLRVSG